MAKPTRIISLVLTWQCNLNCVYCFEKFKSKHKVMTLDVAKQIIQKEFSKFAETDKDGKIIVDYFGGEPLLNFQLIKELSEWTWAQDFPFEYVFSVTTNGTLLNQEMMDWFTQNKERTQMILSVDGTEEMQRENRGCDMRNIPMEFIHKTWPHMYFKVTLSKSTLDTFAQGTIYLLDKGYNTAASFAMGVDWTPEEAQVYKQELQKIADYFLEHLDREPISLLNNVYKELMEPNINQTPNLCCGVNNTTLAYDVDGTSYPCHLFMPLVTGKNLQKEIAEIDFSREGVIDEECSKCGLLRICRTCYGFNYNERGNVNKRDKSNCAMLLAEAQVVSEFQIKRYVAISKQRQLKDEELYALSAAIKCQELVCNYHLDN